MNDTFHIITPNDNKLIIDNSDTNLIISITANSDGLTINNYSKFGNIITPIGCSSKNY